MWHASSSSTRGGRAPTSGRLGDSSSNDEEYKRELAQARVSDAGQKRGARKFTNVGVAPSPRFSYNVVDEVKGKWTERLRLASSSSAYHFLMPKREQTGGELVLHKRPASSPTIWLEDFAGEGEEDIVFDLLLSRITHEAEEEQKRLLDAKVLNQRLLKQGMALAASMGSQPKSAWLS